MAAHQTSPYSSLDDEHEDLRDVSSSGCGCFRLFGFGRNSNFEDGNLLQQQVGGEESWMARRLKKLKEVSEMAAGPKWKNFIRKMGGRKQRNRFQYDAQSYALNFDEEDEDLPPTGFSTRFAVAVPRE